jgi:hypothetical protein
MTLVLSFGRRRMLSVKIGRRLAYLNWSKRVGPGDGRDMWLTANEVILWGRWL